jgi:Tripartite tricarboxylate transporter TctB family
VITRIQMEVATAMATAAAGVLAVTGSRELGAGWSDHGPEPGYFPFWVGLILLGASLWNGAAAVVRSRGRVVSEEGGDIFLDRDQAKRIATFLGPILAFVVMTVFLGFYVASTTYLTWICWRQGKLKPVRAVALGLTFSAVLYVVFEIIFLVPLLKGPLEAALGIY